MCLFLYVVKILLWSTDGSCNWPFASVDFSFAWSMAITLLWSATWRNLLWSADWLLLCTSCYLHGEITLLISWLVATACAHLSKYGENPLLISCLTPTLHITLPTWRILFWSADWLLLYTSLYLHGESSSDQLIDSYCDFSLPIWRILFWSADWLLLCTMHILLSTRREYSSV
jgi:hypothetical protein